MNNNNNTELNNLISKIKEKYENINVIEIICDDISKQNLNDADLSLLSVGLQGADGALGFYISYNNFLKIKNSPPVSVTSMVPSVIFSDTQLKFLRKKLNKWKVGDHMLMGDLGEMMDRGGNVADMFVQAETLRLLRKWEELVPVSALHPSPKLHVVGTAGIGKSGLAFIALARSLALGLKVCLFFNIAPARILALDDGGRLFVEKVPLLSDLHMRGLDRSKLVAIFDSRSSYRDEFTLTDGCFQGVLIVQSPSADFSGLHKVDSLVNEVMAAPAFKEIVAMNRDCAYDIPNDELSKRFDM